MPGDQADEIGAGDPPRLCADHIPVLGNAKHLDDMAHHDTENARAERARQCPQCYALNDRSLR